MARHRHWAYMNQQMCRAIWEVEHFNRLRFVHDSLIYERRKSDADKQDFEMK